MVHAPPLARASTAILSATEAVTGLSQGLEIRPARRYASPSRGGEVTDVAMGKRIYIAGCGGMLGEAFYRCFGAENELRCTDNGVGVNAATVDARLGALGVAPDHAGQRGLFGRGLRDVWLAQGGGRIEGVRDGRAVESWFFPATGGCRPNKTVARRGQNGFTRRLAASTCSLTSGRSAEPPKLP